MTPLCPFCGAYSPRQCELEDEMPGASCPWEDQLFGDENFPSARILALRAGISAALASQQNNTTRAS